MTKSVGRFAYYLYTTKLLYMQGKRMTENDAENTIFYCIY